MVVIAQLLFVYDNIGFQNLPTETRMLMKNSEQLLAASKVLKEARILQAAALQEAKSNDLGFNETIWFEKNTPLEFVEKAYRNLQAVAFRVSVIQGEDEQKGREFAESERLKSKQN
jgi:hypothetical protein